MGYDLKGFTVTNQIVDYGNTLVSAEVESNRLDSPSKMTFTGIESSGIAMPEGTAVEFKDEGQTVFKGFVFTISRDRYGKTEYTCYDQLRYLKANNSYTFTNQSIEDIIRTIAQDFGLTVGDLAPTGYVFPSLIKEDESCLDILFSCLSEVIYRTGKIYNLYDDGGKITLKEAKDMMTTSIIGDASLLTDYTYQRDIDSQTYNRIKLVRPNKESGKTDVWMVEDTETQKQWGLLQYYKKIDENLNEAQIQTLVESYAKYYNRVLQTLEMESIGITGLRAGMMIPVFISAVDTLKIQRILLVEKVSHKYEGGAHTMSLEVKNFEQLGGSA